MDSDLKAWLYDVQNAIYEIDSFFADRPKLFTDSQKDIRTKRAVERNLEIIGEAVNRITKRDTSLLITNARVIIATRNRIIHSYDTVSDEVIWSIVINHLAALQIEITGLFNE